MHLLLVFIFISKTVQSARILGVFTLPVYSHFILGETIFKELAYRGHEVTVISAFPQKEPVKNYKDIEITELKGIVENERTGENLISQMQRSAFRTIRHAYDFYTECAGIALGNGDVQKLLKSEETFDLIILEQFMNEAYFGFMHRFKAPVVLVTTASPSLYNCILTGNPVPYSYMPNFYIDYSPNMNFWQRMHNSLAQTFQTLYFHAYVLPRQDEILHKHFPNAPPIEDLMYNASLVLLNYHSSSGAAVPLQPNMVPIGGFHVHKYKPLSPSLQRFLDEAEEGVVYFSIGSFLKSRYLPKEKVGEILKAFSKLKMKVLCKWEDDDLPGRPDNVRIEKWLPQMAVLAHANVKVFVTHGGRLSIIESLYFGKPILGIPIFAEQGHNVREASHLGYGLYLSLINLNQNNFLEALRETTENPKYGEAAQYRSNALRDLPISPMDNAIYWIEYVLKYKSLSHLRNASLSLKWYQLVLLDVALFFLIALWILNKVITTLFRRMRGIKKEKVKAN